jgi:hypothetical protein
VAGRWIWGLYWQLLATRAELAFFSCRGERRVWQSAASPEPCHDDQATSGEYASSPEQSDRRALLLRIYDELDDAGKQELLRIAQDLLRPR